MVVAVYPAFNNSPVHYLLFLEPHSRVPQRSGIHNILSRRWYIPAYSLRLTKYTMVCLQTVYAPAVRTHLYLGIHTVARRRRFMCST